MKPMEGIIWINQSTAKGVKKVEFKKRY